MKEIAGSVEGTVDVNIEQQTERPQLLIRPRRDVLAARGVRRAICKRHRDSPSADEWYCGL